jgi:hypothetical protein
MLHAQTDGKLSLQLTEEQEFGYICRRTALNTELLLGYQPHKYSPENQYFGDGDILCPHHQGRRVEELHHSVNLTHLL